jgi:flagellar biosynthesis GTPase FlhF
VSEPPFGRPGDDERSDAGQVRTYRGRTIEELIPRIREELGPDAIILREREGLTGGIGGFFAQRCVEIDAQAAPRLSFYDDDFDEDDDPSAEDSYADAVAEDEPPVPAAPQLGPPEPPTFADQPVPPAPPPVADDPPAPPAADQPAPPPARSVADEPARPEPAPATPRRVVTFLDEASFAARLEEATLAADQPAPSAEEEPSPAPEPPRPAPPAFIAFDELGDEDAEEPEPEPEPEPLAPPETGPPTLSHRLLDLAEINYSEPAPDLPERPSAAPVNHEFLAWDPEVLETEPQPVEAEPERVEAEPEPAAPSPAAPEPTAFAPELTAFAPELSAAAPELAPPAPEPAPPEPEPEPQPDPIDLAPDPAAPWMAFAAEQVTAEPLPASRPSAAPAESAAPPPLAPPRAPQSTARPAPQKSLTPLAPEAPARPATQTAPATPAPPAIPVPPAPTPAPQTEAPPSAEPQGAPSGDQLPAGGYPAWPPAAYGPRRRGGILPAAERMLRAALEATHAANERRNLELQARYMAPPQSYSPPPAAPPTATPTPTPTPATPTPATPAAPPTPEATTPTPQPVTPPAPEPLASQPEADTQSARRQEEQRREAQLEERLVQSGISPERAATLVAAAVSRRGPFSADSELTDEVRSAIASALPSARPVPRRGAIGVVGAGGSGKTRSVAALATAYADAGIPVSVASFGGPAREDELGELLHGEEVNIIPAMRTRATARAVASAREESLVIIDTASATPGAGSTIDVIAEALRSFELDAIYLAVPATLSLPAGLKLMSGFAAFDLAGLIATHVDETDQLGTIAELAMRTSVPIAYTHTGLDLQNAIASADSGDIATSLV